MIVYCRDRSVPLPRKRPVIKRGPRAKFVPKNSRLFGHQASKPVGPSVASIPSPLNNQWEADRLIEEMMEE
jgi:hypothetical protein